MATRFLSRSLHASTRQFTSTFSSSCTAAPHVAVPKSFLFRVRPIIAASSANYCRRLAPAFSTRGFSSRPTNSSLNDPNPNWSNRPPKETILLDGCDFEHWLVVMEKPEGDPTRDEIIHSYIKTLASVVGSEEEARMKIYSVSTRHYYAFGALVNEELSYKIKELPRVRWVLPDSYLDVKNKDYGGEPFINGEAVPYDPKYHEEWVRNNARANERNRRNDRPRNFDRSRNFERRRETQNSPNAGGPGGNLVGQPNMPPPPPPPAQHAPRQPNYGPGQQPNYGPGPGQQPNYGPGPNQQPNYGPGPNQQLNYGPGPNQQPNYGPVQGNYGPGQPNYGGGAPNNPGNYPPPSNMGGAPYQSGQGQHPNVHHGGVGSPYQNQNVGGRDVPPPNAGYGGPGLNQGTYNVGPGPAQNQAGYAPENPLQSQNVPGRDFPPKSDY